MFQKLRRMSRSLDARRGRVFSERTEFNDGKSSSTPRTTAFNDDNTGPFLYTVCSSMSLRSSRWNMTTKCRSCSVIPSTMCTSNVRRHYGFLLLTVSCILLALGYRATNYWYHVSSPLYQPICLSVRQVRPTYCYTIVSRSRLSHNERPKHKCV